MKASILFFFLSIFVISTSSFNFEYQIVTSKGIGNITINQSDFKSIKRNFPKGKTTKKTYWKRTFTSLKTTNGQCIIIKSKLKKPHVTKTYELKSEGISFLFSYVSLYSIKVWGLNKYKTDKGIIIGQSSFHDLDSIYGESTFYVKNSRLVKKHENLFFYSSKFKVLDEEKIESNKEFKHLLIEGVEISLFSSRQI